MSAPMRLIFMGTPEAAVPSLRRCIEDGHEVVAVWTQPDRPSGRGNKLTASPVKQFALRHNLPVYQFAKIKTEEALEVFASYGADASVVVAYGRILPLSFLQTPLNGCINVHFSLLPKYRGAAPVNWAIVRGETRTGVTTMRIDEGLDTGAILLQRETEIGPEETAPQLMNRLAELGAGALSDTLNRIDGIEARAQNDEEATHAPVLRREDGLINWSSSAGEIERRVRGFQPWPNAYTLVENRRLVIWRASVLERIDGDDPAGELVEANGDSLVVRCGEGTGLRLLEVQPETKRMMSARDFLNGARLKKGVRLG
ncbi:MAG: methionyl-tRNA formyltransferase [Pyrinomonadaceae bacterium]